MARSRTPTSTRAGPRCVDNRIARPFTDRDEIVLLAAGFEVHLPKPAETAELVAVVARLARSSRAA